MKPWSKLQKELYNLMSNNVHFQIHCSVYRMQSNYGSTDLPRYWISIGKEIIWDYPKQFIKDGKLCTAYGSELNYPYENEISDISNLIREYIDTPKNELLTKEFINDTWFVTPIFLSIDRRLGKAALYNYITSLKNDSTFKTIVIELFNLRFKKL